MDFDEKNAQPEIVRGTLPRNRQARNAGRVARTQKRMPTEGVTHYRVRTRGVPRFRRAGIEFGIDPKIVEASSLTHQQQVELLNTPSLFVEENRIDSARAQGEPDAPPPPPQEPEGPVATLPPGGVTTAPPAAPTVKTKK